MLVRHRGLGWEGTKPLAKSLMVGNNPGPTGLLCCVHEQKSATIVSQGNESCPTGCHLVYIHSVRIFG